MRPARLAALCLVAAGAAYGGVLGWNSPALELRRVEVAGNERVAKEALVETSRLERGMHLLNISTEKVASRVESIPWVETARVERIIPSRVRITVKERTPAAQVITPASVLVADGDGVILEVALSSWELPKLADVPTENTEPGNSITAPQYRHALEILGSLDPELGARVVLTRAPSVDGITLQLDDGVNVLFGAAEAIREKNHALRALLADAAARGIAVATIDIRVPRRPAVRQR